jgi:hypothetical protein
VIQSTDYSNTIRLNTSVLNPFKLRVILILAHGFLFLAVCSLLLLPGKPQVLTPKRIVLHLKDVFLKYDAEGIMCTVYAYGDVISQGSDWDIVKAKAANHVYHLRHKKWGRIFWLIDLQEHKVYQISSGHFQLYNESEREEATPLSIKVDSEGNSENPAGFTVFFLDTRLLYEPKRKMLTIESQHNVISTGKSWKIKALKRVSPISTIKREVIIGYHLRRNFWRRVYWEVNIVQKKVYRVEGGSFGKGGGSFALMDISVDIEE